MTKVLPSCIHGRVFCSHGCHDNIDYDWEGDWTYEPDDDDTSGLFVIDIRLCPMCGEGREEDGECGIIPHILVYHPESWQAEKINRTTGGLSI